MKFSLFDYNNERSPLKISYEEHGVVQKLGLHLYHIFSNLPADQSIVLVCIGTDRSTGDSLGPLVGRNLRHISSFPNVMLFGTLDHPVHAMNLEQTFNEIKQKFFDPFIIAIDACLGQVSSVGYIQVGSGPLKPGAGVKKDLPAIGDIHITGIVNVGGFMEYFVLQNTRLNLVMRMSEVIADSIHTAIHLRSTRTPDISPLR
ncbi:MAG: spore protease YyaC [Paenibacillus sp. RIFOXYA1_FULL_44_5]|nr:MAG: spore protease YyaC [Paenibacillus sp. RIFOXYA1_FULL_44_5]